MALPSVLESGLHVKGNLSARTMTIPDNTVTSASVKAGTNISSAKLQHRYERVYAQDGKAGAGEATNETKVIHVGSADGTVNSIKIGATTAPTIGGGGWAKVDLLLNGESILISQVELNDSTYPTAYALLLGTLSTTTFEENDVLEIEITTNNACETIGDLPQGLFVKVQIDENGVTT